MESYAKTIRGEVKKNLLFSSKPTTKLTRVGGENVIKHQTETMRMKFFNFSRNFYAKRKFASSFFNSVNFYVMRAHLVFQSKILGGGEKKYA